MSKLRGRFAPSPSGEMHLGNAWTALMAWLDIRSFGGTMVLRMEDLDPDRCRKEYAEQVLEDLRWLGLDWDEGPDCGGPYQPYIQDERRGRYEEALESLTGRDLTYPCYCTRAEILGAASAPHLGEGETPYPGLCRDLREGERADRASRGRKPALRVRVPEEEICFADGVYGRVCQDLSRSCGDFIVRRSDGVHAYQLAVVVDDAAMAIDRVVRGDDLLGSTPRQLYLYRLLGLKAPAFAHVPLLFSPDGHRLSKRQKDLSLAALRSAGVAPEAVVGCLAWKAGLIARREAVRASDLVAGFALERIKPEPVIIENNLFHSI